MLRTSFLPHFSATWRRKVENELLADSRGGTLDQTCSKLRRSAFAPSPSLSVSSSKTKSLEASVISPLPLPPVGLQSSPKFLQSASPHPASSTLSFSTLSLALSLSMCAFPMSITSVAQRNPFFSFSLFSSDSDEMERGRDQTCGLPLRRSRSTRTRSLVRLHCVLEPLRSVKRRRARRPKVRTRFSASVASLSLVSHFRGRLDVRCKKPALVIFLTFVPRSLLRGLRAPRRWT